MRDSPTGRLPNPYEVNGPGPQLVFLGRDGGLWWPADLPKAGHEMAELERRLCIALLELGLDNLRKEQS